MIFGKKEIFAIEYNLIEHPYGDEYGIMLDSWGELKIWFENYDLLEMYELKNNNQREYISYRWNLIKITEWFSTNWQYISKIDEFPNGIIANNANQYLKINNALMPKLKDNDEFWKWHDNQYKWLEKHWFRFAADDSLLASITIRRNAKYIELCWDNTGMFDDMNIYFNKIKGCGLIDVSVFTDVILGFVNDFDARFKDKYPDKMKVIIDNFHN